MYRVRAAQCLVLANYTKPGAYTVETILLYSQVEFLLCNDAQVSVWVILGMTVRLAMRMGYHRDSKHYPNVSPFQGEMRRRTWALLAQIDLLASFQMGLPRMIRKSDGDASPPHNLVDDDFDEESFQLPPSRPENDQTPVSYAVAKGRICDVFTRIVDQVSSIGITAYDNLLKTDGDLQDAQNAIPPYLKMKPMEHSIADPPYLIMQRYNIDLLYHKARCVLHRNYLTESRLDFRYSYSRITCVDAAMKLLQHHWVLHQETRPGGQLDRDRWFMQSLTNSDFLLAAMVVCLDICNGTDAEPSLSNTQGIQKWSRSDLLQAIEVSYNIWTESRTMSTEANKACEVLAVLLRRLKKSQPMENLTIQDLSNTSLSNDAEYMVVTSNGKSNRVPLLDLRPANRRRNKVLFQQIHTRRRSMSTTTHLIQI